MIELGIRLPFYGAHGGLAPAPAGSTGTPGPTGPVALPVTPSTRWHPAFSTTNTSNGRVVSASDLSDAASVSEGAPGAGPLALLDDTGTPFWRFEGDAYLNVAASLVCDSQDMSVFMVGRAPRHPPAWNRYFSIGNRALDTQINTGNAPLESRIVSQSAGHLSSFGKNAYTASSGAEWMVPGAQMQVMGAATTPDGSRLFLNDRFVDVAKAYARTGVIGGEIGRYAFSPGNAGSWGVFDLYEMIVFSPGLSYADGLAVSQALMQAHGIVGVQNQLVLEGDSIMQGTGSVTAHLSAAALMTNPGAALLGPTWRVINKAVSGNRVSHLVTRRDTAHSWSQQMLPGQNVLAFEIGRNDFASGGQSAAQHYANVTAYLNTPNTGVLQRGWQARVMANIAGSSNHQSKIAAHRSAIRAPAFLSDTLSAPGQSFAGQVSVIETDLIMQAGDTVFSDIADAADTAYYVGDNTHPNISGAALRVNGGDTPQYAITAGL